MNVAGDADSKAGNEEKALPRSGEGQKPRLSSQLRVVGIHSASSCCVLVEVKLML